MSTYTFTSSLLTAINRYSKFNALNAPFFDSDEANNPFSTGAGYMAGGYSGPTYISTILKLAFTNDSISTLSSNLPANGAFLHGFASSTAGYLPGGIYPDGSPATVSTIQKITVSDDSISQIPAVLEAVIRNGASFQSTTAGYKAGGFAAASGPPANSATSVRKLVFSSETASTIPATLSRKTDGCRGIASTTHGYVFGGQSRDLPSSGTFIYPTDLQKFAFSDDSSSVSSATLSVGGSGNGNKPGFASPTAGYVQLGQSTTNVDKILFSTDTRSTLVSGTSGGFKAGLQSTKAGFFAGQGTGVDKMIFSTETFAATTSLPAGRNAPGYFSV